MCYPDQPYSHQGPPKTKTELQAVAKIENQDWEFWKEKCVTLDRSHKARAEKLLLDLEIKSVQCSMTERLLGDLLAMPALKFFFKGKKTIQAFLEKDESTETMYGSEFKAWPH